MLTHLGCVTGRWPGVHAARGNVLQLQYAVRPSPYCQSFNKCCLNPKPDLETSRMPMTTLQDYSSDRLMLWSYTKKLPHVP